MEILTSRRPHVVHWLYQWKGVTSVLEGIRTRWLIAHHARILSHKRSTLVAQTKVLIALDRLTDIRPRLSK